MMMTPVGAGVDMPEDGTVLQVVDVQDIPATPLIRHNTVFKAEVMFRMEPAASVSNTTQ